MWTGGVRYGVGKVQHGEVRQRHGQVLCSRVLAKYSLVKSGDGKVKHRDVQ